HRYPANGMPVRGISGAFPHWLVCKDFAIKLGMWKMSVFRSVFSRRQHIGAETGDSAAPEKTDCQKDSRTRFFICIQLPDGSMRRGNSSPPPEMQKPRENIFFILPERDFRNFHLSLQG
ncbi:hypothetical protein, partial [uncultured Bacteroides sp.]